MIAVPWTLIRAAGLRVEASKFRGKKCSPQPSGGEMPPFFVGSFRVQVDGSIQVAPKKTLLR